MKWIMVVVMIMVFNGCQTTPQNVNPNYQAYVSASTDRRPLLDLELTEDGRIKRITVDQAVNLIPYRRSYHPAWGIFGKAATVVGGIFAAGWAMDQVLENVGGSASTIGSYNSVGKGYDFDYTNTMFDNSFGGWNFPTTTNP